MDESIPISFPGLHLSFPVHSTAFTIGSYPIKWYGILIALGMLLALFYAMKRAPQFKISIDDLSDVVIFSVIFGIIGARLYYVIFYVDPMTQSPYILNPLSILEIWKGGLGIYGGIIASFLTALIVCKKKKISTGAVYDIAALGFLIGQAVGRWGNFFNREAYGAATSLPWRMVIDSTGTGYNPCFFYESMWCIVGFIILHNVSKHRKFNGEIFLLYIMWYGFGRFFIEGLRTDSLMIGTMKISQVVALLSFVAALVLLLVKRHQAVTSGVGKVYAPMYEDASPTDDEIAASDDDAGAPEEDEGTSDAGTDTAEDTTETPEIDGSEDTPAGGDARDDAAPGDETEPSDQKDETEE